MSKIREGGKFFSEDRDRAFEAKVCRKVSMMKLPDKFSADCGRTAETAGVSANARKGLRWETPVLRSEHQRDYQAMHRCWLA